MSSLGAIIAIVMHPPSLPLALMLFSVSFHFSSHYRLHKTTSVQTMVIWVWSFVLKWKVWIDSWLSMVFSIIFSNTNINILLLFLGSPTFASITGKIIAYVNLIFWNKHNSSIWVSNLHSYPMKCLSVVVFWMLVSLLLIVDLKAEDTHNFKIFIVISKTGWSII